MSAKKQLNHASKALESDQLKVMIGEDQQLALAEGLKPGGHSNESAADQLLNMADTFAKVPALFSQDPSGDMSTAYLHYSTTDGRHFWVTEMDQHNPGAKQDFYGFTLSTHGRIAAGYINLPKILETTDAKLDINFKQTSMINIMMDYKNGVLNSDKAELDGPDLEAMSDHAIYSKSKDVLRTGKLSEFLTVRQLETLKFLSSPACEEGLGFAKKIIMLEHDINSIPEAQNQDIVGDSAIACLHFLSEGKDTWVVSKVPRTGGFQCLEHQYMGNDNPRMVHLSIEEILESDAELDLYYEPAPLGDIQSAITVESESVIEYAMG